MGDAEMSCEETNKVQNDPTKKVYLQLTPFKYVVLVKNTTVQNHKKFSLLHNKPYIMIHENKK